jgi:transposase-like protein
MICTNKIRDVKFADKEETKSGKIERNQTKEGAHQWKKKGFHKGKQRWQCLFCNSMTNDKELHSCKL